jgi:hypothetical protein
VSAALLTEEAVRQALQEAARRGAAERQAQVVRTLRGRARRLRTEGVSCAANFFEREAVLKAALVLELCANDLEKSDPLKELV